jgi:ATP-dependent DNA helicase RecG
LARHDLETVEDLLYVLPARYDDRRSFARIIDLVPGGPKCTLSVRILSSRLIRTRKRGFTIFEALITDDSGSIRVVWYNQPYLERVIVAGRDAVFYGRASYNRLNELVIENPDYEFLDDEDAEGIHTGRVVPVYRKQGDLSPKMLRRVMHQALSDLDPASLKELVPPEVAKRHAVLGRLRALRETHFPPQGVSLDELEDKRTPGQRSLAFEEVFLLQLALALRRYGVKHENRGIAYEVPDALRTRLADFLPFKLTGAQRQVLKDIGADLKSEHPMNRLLQGDVGSGKTIVALLTLLVAVDNGFQGALMAPTEILVEQHYRNITALLDQGGLNYDVALLTGSLKAAARRQVLERIRSGEANLVIGTHALFEAGVEFQRLGLVVIDEQHRFGVLQRAALAEKGTRPDVLVMTATPIPRSLALTFYGDLDFSIIDEMPPGRTPVKTVTRHEDQRTKVYEGLRAEIAKGRQVYIVVPLVEETEKSDRKAAEEFAVKLRKDEFRGLEVGMVHGRMKGEEKDRVMRSFAAGRIPVLVATTVIEVGVDIPNATVMVIEHAERFGLSQLHQLRGRVGRGSQRSYCVLMVGEGEHSDEARERLSIMTETNDGFKIAERDYQLRGPGAIFGTQQHGLSDLQFLGAALRHPGLVDGARLEAQRMVDGGDASLGRARDLLAALRGRWRRRLDLARVG